LTHAIWPWSRLIPENIPFATGMTLLQRSSECFLAWRRKPIEAIRYGGVLFLFPLMFYFIHPEAYRMPRLIRCS